MLSKPDFKVKKKNIGCNKWYLKNLIILSKNIKKWSFLYFLLGLDFSYELHHTLR